MSPVTTLINESALEGKSASEVMSEVSAAMWKAGIDESVIAEYCVKVRGCADGAQALEVTRTWVASL